MNQHKTKQKPNKKPYEDRLYIDQLKSVPLFVSIDENKKFLDDIFKDSSDAVVRLFQVEKGPRALVVYIDGLAKTDAVDLAVKSLMFYNESYTLIDRITNASLPVTQVSQANNFGDLLSQVLSGDSALLVDGNVTAIAMGLRGSEHRAVSEPETESVIRGPREGYTENLRTNTALLRKKIKSPRLKMKPLVVGRDTNTNVVVSYMEHLADPALVDEVVMRIQKIQIDGILETGYIEELIQDQGFSPFPQVQYTERPDTTAAALLEGRIAVFVDGTPFVIIAPMLFWQWIQASEDYYERFFYATLLRILRFIFLFVAMLTPSLYIAITTFHQEMIPTNLLLSIATSREPIPFPAVVEAFIMEIAFEALREAGIRLPRTIGQAVSIVGALVVGQAAVQAGIVSAAMVIVVSITGIASFTLPRYNAAISVRILRFPIMVLASIFGLLGIIIGIMLIFGHLSRLRSFGIPYLSPLGPMSVPDLKDTLFRAPWWSMRKRPSYMGVAHADRLGDTVTGDIAAEKGQTGAKNEHGHSEKN